MSQRGKGFEFPFGAYDDPGKEIVDLVIKAYDAEIRYVDTELKNLIDKLKNLGQLDENDWLFITADHGEEFYERGGWGHGHSLFEDQIHVPLIVLGPDMGKGLRQPQEVNLLDVHTTIGDITGYSPMPASPGASLRPLGDGQRHTEGNQERILYSERLQGTRQLYAVRQGNLKMIERPDDEARAADPDSLDTITMWFDLEANPSEDPGFDFRDLIEGPNSKWRELPPFQDPPDELSGMMVHARGPDMALKGAVEGATARMTPAEIQALIEMGYLTKDGKAIHGGAGFKATSDEND